MIKTFAHKGLEDFFYDGGKKGIQSRHAQKIGDILDLLDAAAKAEDIELSGIGPPPNERGPERRVGGEGIGKLANNLQVLGWRCLRCKS